MPAAASSTTVVTYWASWRARTNDGPTVRFHRGDVRTVSDTCASSILPPTSLRQRPSGYEFAIYGQGLGSITRSGNQYQVQVPHAGGTSEFTVPDRSFTTRSLRGNAVLRWEYRPGSTIFFVWQQERLNHEYMSSFGLDRAVGSLFDAHPNNVFVVKWNYWINP